jgi:hypothetical protein
MYKKVTKIKKVVTQYDKPYERDEDDEDMNTVETETETKVYGDTVCMDIPFFIKLLEHVNTKVATTAELQVFAENVITRAKEYPVLTGEWFETLI